MKTTFRTTLKAFGNNTGIVVPAANLAELGGSKKPPVKVTVNGYAYDSTVASMGGEFLISLSKAHREAAGLKGGDEVTVTLELDAASRTVDVPDSLKAALQQGDLLGDFEKLSVSKRKAHVLSVSEAKTEETRQKRIQKVLDTLKETEHG